MCGSYWPEDGNLYRASVPASQALIERTRMIESSMEGDPVPDTAWDAFLSAACGVIAGAHFQRMFHARRAAAAYLAIQASSRRRPRPRSSFRCVAD